MADFGDSFDQLADTEMWENVAVLFAGFLAGTLMKNTIEGRLERNLPDEAYGAVVIVLSVSFLDGEFQQFGALGGGLYTADKLAERFDIKSAVLEGV